MKLKVLVVDFEMSARARRWLTCLGIPLATLLGFGAVAWAAVPHTWKDQDLLDANDLNENFADIDRRVGALEARLTPSGFMASVNVGFPIKSGPAGSETGAETPVIFERVSFELSSPAEYNPATGVFKAANGGRYFVQCSLDFVPQAAGVYSVSIYVNSAQATVDSASAHGSVAGVHAQASLFVNLAKDDTLQCRGWQNSGVDQNLHVFTSRNHFLAFRVP